MSNRKKIKNNRKVQKNKENEDELNLFMKIIIILAIIILLLASTIFRGNKSAIDYYPGKWFDDIRRER
ncbi:hypothetical protein [Dysgonomonas sp. GY75]|uniref:hypothetical protein n=1 Tax=Dysgonomonas sp. GY75 TaxID=2780419 RepID=UPI001A7F105E|nr:hypothetical protein [Dysgonomonas sp. GY75]